MSVTELPAGKYDAVRTLRHLLAQAERGEFDSVVVVCRKEGAEDAAVWASWSDMDASDVWWTAGWFTSYLYRRYFGGSGLVSNGD